MIVEVLRHLAHRYLLHAASERDSPLRRHDVRRNPTSCLSIGPLPSEGLAVAGSSATRAMIAS
eukprot:4341251-Heterocapsa_arctica.AAC.1